MKLSLRLKATLALAYRDAATLRMVRTAEQLAGVIEGAILPSALYDLIPRWCDSAGDLAGHLSAYDDAESRRSKAIVGRLLDALIQAASLVGEVDECCEAAE